MKNDFLKPYICSQCGGKVNRETLVCEMCGTTFKDMSSPETIKLVVDKPGVHVLKNTRVIDDEMIMTFGAEETSRMVLDHMAKEMAQCIAPFMDVKTEKDIMHHQTIVHSRLRVLDPTHRF